MTQNIIHNTFKNYKSSFASSVRTLKENIRKATKIAVFGSVAYLGYRWMFGDHNYFSILNSTFKAHPLTSVTLGSMILILGYSHFKTSSNIKNGIANAVKHMGLATIALTTALAPGIIKHVETPAFDQTKYFHILEKAEQEVGKFTAVGNLTQMYDTLLKNAWLQHPLVMLGAGAIGFAALAYKTVVAHTEHRLAKFIKTAAVLNAIAAPFMSAITGIIYPETMGCSILWSAALYLVGAMLERIY